MSDIDFRMMGAVEFLKEYGEQAKKAYLVIAHNGEETRCVVSGDPRILTYALAATMARIARNGVEEGRERSYFQHVAEMAEEYYDSDDGKETPLN